jgi:hypothetical protein
VYAFCTYFDRHYLPRFLALYDSLRACGTEFRLWALCLDDAAHGAVTDLRLAGVEPIALADFERGDTALLAAKQDRTRAEYFFTCTPSLPLYVLERWPEVDLITYLDADLFFFSHPRPVFEELGDASVGIIGHRHSPANRDRVRFGVYNVGWVSFRRDANGLDCLRQWRQDCLTWCYDRVEAHRYADQKYLDAWPERHDGVRVLQQKGANLAPWNVANYRIRARDGRVDVDDDPLVFFHFQGFQQVAPWLFNSNFGLYHARPTSVMRRSVIGPYIEALGKATRATRIPRGIRNGERRHGFPLRQLRRVARLALGLIHREYVIVVRNRVL